MAALRLSANPVMLAFGVAALLRLPMRLKSVGESDGAGPRCGIPGCGHNT